MQLHPFKYALASFILLSTAIFAFGQNGPISTTLADLKTDPPPVSNFTTADIMRTRISKAKASLVVKNYQAAIYELENIRLETNDETVHRVINVLLMHAYLEQAEYGKAQKFLSVLAKDKLRPDDYFAVASQAISGARTQYARYQTMGISVSDAALPDEAKKDLDGMRETLELVITQTREFSGNRASTSTAAAVLEESGTARGNLARDAYDSKRWKDQVADAREQIVKPRSKVINAVGLPPQPELTLVAKIEAPDTAVESASSPASTKIEEPISGQVSLKAVEDKSTAVSDTIQADLPKSVSAEEKKAKPTDRKTRVISSKPGETDAALTSKEEQPNVKSTDQVDEKKKSEDSVSQTDAAAVDSSPLTIGSLIGYATKTYTPAYPAQARSLRMSGTVTVEVTVDEEGKVSKVDNTSGPSLLKRAAQDAVRRWEFTPFVRDGQPVKATGYVSFNFNM